MLEVLDETGWEELFEQNASMGPTVCAVAGAGPATALWWTWWWVMGPVFTLITGAKVILGAVPWAKVNVLPLRTPRHWLNASAIGPAHWSVVTASHGAASSLLLFPSPISTSGSGSALIPTHAYTICVAPQHVGRRRGGRG